MPTRARILVIDDDPLFRSLIVTLLRKEFLVSVASEGSEGFYKSLEHPPDIAIVDIQMPGWDGLQTLKAFRAHPFLNQVKILIMTSDSSRETVLAAMHGGANDYVVKASFSKDELLDKLRQLLSASGIDQSAKPVAIDPPRMGIGTEPEVTSAKSTKTIGARQEPLDDCLAAHDNDAAVDAGLQEIIDGWE